MPNTASTSTTQPAQHASRTRVVWAALAVGMTAVTGLLAVVDPGSSFGRGGVSLPALAAAAGSTSLETVFETRSPEQAWKAIVIHHAATPFATPESLDELHREQGLTGLGHHFIIGNSNGLADGEIHVGYRWLDQLPGAHAGGEHGAWYNRHAIGIVLAGNGDRRNFTDQQIARLVDLVASLCERYEIPSESVLLHSDIAQTTSPGRYFPEATFRESLDFLN